MSYISLKTKRRQKHSYGNRCGHKWCWSCKKKRGWNYGNRRIRHLIKDQLHRVNPDA